MATTDLTALFAPESIALIRSSGRPGSIGAVLADNLRGYHGELWIVDYFAEREHWRTEGRRVDLAVVVVPAEAVAGAVRLAAAAGARVCVVLSGGFAETGAAGAALQRELVQVAADAGIRLVGPNCLGVQNWGAGLNASLAPQAQALIGGTSLVTQSGAYAMALQSLAADESMGFDKVVSTGNRADLRDSEYLEYLGSSGGGPLCFYLESLPEGREFTEIARGLAQRGRPVIVCRTGNSADGGRAARSHSASPAGRRRIWSAAFDAANVIQVRSGLEMLDAARAIDWQPSPRGRRAAVISNSGGVGVELTDFLAVEGVSVPPLSEPVKQRLRDVVPAVGSVENPIDVTTAWRRFAEIYPAAIEQLARSGEVDLIVVVLLQRSATHDLAQVVADRVRGLRDGGVEIPVYVCWIASRETLTHADPLRRARIPVFEWPERTARAVGHAARFGSPPGTPQSTATGHEGAGAASNSDDSGRWVELDESADLLESVAVPLLRGVVCDSVAMASEAAASMNSPLVLKALHPDLLHKHSAGAISLNLGADEVNEVAERLLELRRGATVLVQEQLTGTEVFVGGVRDKEFGPVLMVGRGGVGVEDETDLHVESIPLRPGATGRLAQAVARLAAGDAHSDILRALLGVGELLGRDDDILELDLNPIIVTGDGARAVDWRIRRR